ncbi:MAG: four helix bundle protein [Bacteroidota bacterium]
MKKMTPQELEDRLIDFASRIIDLVEALPKGVAARHLGGQIVRSGTSPALNYGEARGAESPSDFVHKLKVCLKELRETYICMKIIDKRNWFPKGKLNSLLKENDELIAIFVSSVKTHGGNKK